MTGVHSRGLASVQGFRGRGKGAGLLRFRVWGLV